MLHELNQLSAELTNLPPSPQNWLSRRPILRRMDSILAEADAENSPELCEFYHRQCRRVLQEIHDWHEPRLRLWKLYSSGILIKDAGGTVTGFDLNDGCTPHNRRSRLHLSPELAEKFASVIAVMYYTHGHLDHLGLDIADALLRRQKTVIAPQALIDQWLLNGAVAADHLQRTGVATFASKQSIVGEPDIVNFAYAVTLPPGITFFVRGDIYCGSDFLTVLNQLAATGIRTDVALISPFSLTPPSPVMELNRRFHCRFLPLHEWEFSHRPPATSGTATQSFDDLYREFEQPGNDGRCDILSWGESIVISPKSTN